MKGPRSFLHQENVAVIFSALLGEKWRGEFVNYYNNNFLKP